ncbi:MAG: DegV family protein [Oscillospiraceae bacterium]|jgi:DegV family protein with EDD domain
MERRIILSADSTCDIGPELRDRYQVHFLPFHIILDGTDHLDNVTITATEIFDAYKKDKLLPTTAAISVGECVDYFRQWTDQGYEVIHINLGSSLSATYQNCCIAAEMLDGVYPIDSCNLSTGTGHLVAEAGKLIQEGEQSAAEIAQAVRGMTGKVHASFILDTLTYLAAGGRCSTLAALGANLLNLKPCIEVENDSGKMHVGKKYRGNLKEVLRRYVEDKLRAYPNIRKERIFITYSTISPELETMVRDIVEATMSFDEVFTTRASCTISSHCGPNTLGILFMTE